MNFWPENIQYVFFEALSVEECNLNKTPALSSHCPDWATLSLKKYKSTFPFIWTKEMPQLNPPSINQNTC